MPNRLLPNVMLPAALLVAAYTPLAQSQTWENSGSPATIVELYTSEGCSSCPSADKKLGELTRSPMLWSGVIPLAFHVDYWNNLGWPDRFSSADYSKRQRNKVRQGQAEGVYTPGWFINNREWRGFFSRQDVQIKKRPEAETLAASLENGTISISYQGSGTFKANVALLAMDETTKVERGENRGETLKHDFVVVDFAQYSGQNNWTHKVSSEFSAKPDAIAVWLTRTDNSQPVQTVAGWLER